MLTSPHATLRRAAALLLALVVLALAGCDSSDSSPPPDDDPPPPPTTTGSISGTISLPAGAGGSIENTRVSLFESVDEFERNLPTFTAATNSSGSFSFENINPGSYFIAAWKDNNNNGVIDGGDYFGVIGTNQIEGFVPQRQQVVAGQNTGFNITILILPPGYGVSVTGSYSGSSQGLTLSMTLTQSGTSVSGSGQIIAGEVYPVSVSGSFNAPNVNLTLANPQLAPITLQGTVSNDGRSINATLNGAGLENLAITLNLQ